MTAPGRHRFETTRWSLVIAAGGDRSSAARRALADLCEAYWYPLYSYVRRQGYEAEEARDLTQSFFVVLLERDDVRGLRRERGRFRSFLLASLRHFLLKDLKHKRRLKRGGGQTPISLEFATAEDRYSREPADRNTPETIFDRRWAQAMLERVLQSLRADWEVAGKEAQFDRLKGCLMGELPRGGYEVLASELCSTEGALKIAVHRLRRRFQARLREAIAQTVLTEDAIDDEIEHLFKALRA